MKMCFLIKEEAPIARLFLHLIMIEILFFSGEVYYTSTMFGGGGKSQLVFLITCTIYFLVSYKKFHPYHINIKTLLFIIVWVLLCTFILGQGSHDLSWLLYVIAALSMFLVMSIVDFERFRNMLLRYLICLSIISIIVQVGHDYFGIFPTKAYLDGTGVVRNLSLGLFNTEWTWGENRLASFFWEPGQYQIVIYYVLILFADEWSNIATLRKSILKFGILILALIMTNSTTAYLMLGLVFFIILIRGGRMYVRYLPIMLLLSGIVVFFLYSSDAVQKKVEQRENADVEESSYTIRMADNIGCLMVTLDDPLTGFGPGSTEMKKRLLSKGSSTSSNGWLYGSAQLGLPYILFLWVCMWRNLKRMVFQTNTFLLFLILLLSQANEAAIYLPYMYMYVFRFRKR